MNPKSISRMNLSPDVVDGIVFWTKNPKPMIERLDELCEYPYYFQFSLASYGNDVERYLPPKKEIIDTFKELSDKIGANRVIWRFDPILINEKYSTDYHIEYFAKFAKLLNGYTRKCTISFVDYYRSIENSIKDLKLKEITECNMRYIAAQFSAIAKANEIKIDTCAEKIDLSEYGINRAKCVDASIFKDITGYSYDIKKDKNQRAECGCAASIDIGAYNTCRNGCKYCYANHSAKLVEKNFTLFDTQSPLLCGKEKDDDVIRDREVKSCKDGQIKFDIIR